MHWWNHGGIDTLPLNKTAGPKVRRLTAVKKLHKTIAMKQFLWICRGAPGELQRQKQAGTKCVAD
jgi:hypothetical protein